MTIKSQASYLRFSIHHILRRILRNLRIHRILRDRILHTRRILHRILRILHRTLHTRLRTRHRIRQRRHRQPLQRRPELPPRTSFYFSLFQQFG